MKRYIRDSGAVISLSDVLKRVVCIKFCDDLNREPTKLAEFSPICAEESMSDLLPDDDCIMTYTDEQLLELCTDDELKIQVKSLTKPELLLRIYRLDRDSLSAKQLLGIKAYLSRRTPKIDEAGVKLLLQKMHRCHNIQYSGTHTKTNLFILDPDGNVRTKDCADVLNSLTVANWDKKPFFSEDNAYLGDILIAFQVHSNWVDDDGKLFDDLCIYIKVDLNKTTGDSILLVTMHPADRDDVPVKLFDL